MSLARGVTVGEPGSISDPTLSPDERRIVVSNQGRGAGAASLMLVDPASRGNLWVLPRTGDGKPYPFVATAAAESGARFSPDGRFVAYTSDDSGRDEVFVQPFPPTGAKWQVSSAGGVEAAWPGDVVASPIVVVLGPPARGAPKP